MHLTPARTRTRTRTLLLAAAAAATALFLSACSSSVSGGGPSQETAKFGPFEAEAASVSESRINGPTAILLPDDATAELDAAALLGTGAELPPLPDLENYRVTSEQYTYTLDGKRPVLVGVVQATHTMHFRGYTEDEFVTFVLGISAEEVPREISRTRILRGGEHTATIAGRSDLGVVAVLLTGALNTNVPHDSRLVGVDAVRATEVWGKEHGYPGYGEETATFYLAASPDACATRVEQYTVANGIPESVEEFADAQPGDATCRLPNGDEHPVPSL
ncbi:hypothetical protein FB468_0323 [Leucobacter komagatae]|uniref:Lipoprotein n=1 Tax=Leucobacter komagatae TaxID=55969 RepID=A0A542Y2N1_9MICO|nr:hypothetical protein [Leucobacter komagatae]TQL42334.1 hypothetical protein FB468_0323 [Leucobacter komagatae]